MNRKMTLSLMTLMLFLIFTCPAQSAGSKVKIANSGFELSGERDFPANWYIEKGEPSVPGITIKRDTGTAHKSSASLMMFHQQPAQSTLLSAPLFLKVGKLYRLSGWIKTETATTNPVDRYPTSVAACLTMASFPFTNHSPSVGGDTDWKEISTLFVATAPEDRVRLHFGFNGKAAGKSYFDNLLVEEVTDISRYIPMETVRWFWPAFRYDDKGWIFIHIEGKPYQRGYQHGFLLAEEIVSYIKKLSYEEYGNLFTLYKENYQKFIDYNIKDVLLVERLEDKTKMMELAWEMAYKGGVNYNEAFGTTSLWDTYIYRELCRQKKVVPPKIDRPDMPIVGGYVKSPMVGRHEWVISFDLNSLYPHLMMQFNMSPETLTDMRTSGVTVDNCLNQTRPDSIAPDHAICANGVHFRKDFRGTIPKIIEGLYAERKAVKKEMLATQQQMEKGVVGKKVGEKTVTKLNTQQMGIKIMMNALYGAMGNKWFRYYDVRFAEAVTTSGQLAIRWAEKTVNNYMNSLLGTDNKDYVIAIDTDSVYINFGPMVEQMGLTDKAQTVRVLDEIAEKKFVPVIEKS